MIFKMWQGVFQVNLEGGILILSKWKLALKNESNEKKKGFRIHQKSRTSLFVLTKFK